MFAGGQLCARVAHLNFKVNPYVSGSIYARRCAIDSQNSQILILCTHYCLVHFGTFTIQIPHKKTSKVHQHFQVSGCYASTPLFGPMYSI